MADRRVYIDVMENVPRGNADCQIVTVIVRPAAVHAAAAAKASAARASISRASGPASKRSSSTGSAGPSVRWLGFLAETECLAEPKIQSETPRAFREVTGHTSLSGLRCQVTTPIRRIPAPPPAQPHTPTLHPAI